MNSWTRMDGRERTALIVSAAMVLTAAVYWIVQIEGVRAMLKLAYG